MFVKKFMISIFLFVSVLQFISAQILDVHISNIRNLKGQLCIAVFSNQTDFCSEKTVYDLKYTKADVKNAELHIKIPVKQGKYGISVLDDENQTGKMEYGLFGIPLKGFGFSNYYHKGLLKPVFDDFSFNIEKDEIKILSVKMRYF